MNSSTPTGEEPLLQTWQQLAQRRERRGFNADHAVTARAADTIDRIDCKQRQTNRGQHRKSDRKGQLFAHLSGLRKAGCNIGLEGHLDKRS